MISHKHECIFIHIQCCAGTSFEYWLAGRDWWHIDSRTKHLTAAQAKQEYAKWWDKYFKFAIIREPHDRLASLAKFRCWGIRQNPKYLDFTRYAKMIGDPPVEHDFRFRSHPGEGAAGAMYQNILGDEMDFVGRFEQLDEAVREVARKIKGAPHVELFPHLNAATNRNDEPWQTFFNDEGMEFVHSIHGAETEQFRYETKARVDQGIDDGTTTRDHLGTHADTSSIARSGYSA